MSDHRHYSGLQFVAGGVVFFAGFFELFPTIQLTIQSLLSLPILPVSCLVFIAAAAGLARFSGLGFWTSMLLSTLIAVFVLMIYFPGSPIEVGLMMLSSFGMAIAAPSRL